MGARIVRCRMLNAKSDQCTAEAVDPDGEIIICQSHLALALELLTVRTGLAADLDDVRVVGEDMQATRDGVRGIRDDLRGALGTPASGG